MTDYKMIARDRKSTIIAKEGERENENKIESHRNLLACFLSHTFYSEVKKIYGQLRVKSKLLGKTIDRILKYVSGCLKTSYLCYDKCP